MSVSSHPVLRPPLYLSGTFLGGYLFLVSWLLCGISLWIYLGADSWIVLQRSPVVLEAFLADTVSQGQAEDIMNEMQSQAFCCRADYVSSDEARERAAADEQVRGLLEVLGSNPFPRSVRITLCSSQAGSAGEARRFLASIPGVTSVRAPDAQLSEMAAAEKKTAFSMRISASAAGFLGFLAALGAFSLYGRGLREELSDLELMGAGPAKLAGRSFWVMIRPALISSMLAAIVLELLSVFSKFGRFWGLGSSLVIPDFPDSAALALIAAAFALALFSAAWNLLQRAASRPE